MAENVLRYNIIVIGGSAGSLPVILQIVSDLPHRLSAAVIIVVHRKSSGDSVLPNLLAARTSMEVREVEDKEPIVPGVVYIAPADYHLLIENEQTFALDSSEKVNYSRPSIDVTFSSVAEVFGKKAIGILLSGANADGADGLLQLKESGGFSIVQDPATADVGYMPEQAILQNAGSRIIKPDDMGTLLAQLLT